MRAINVIKLKNGIIHFINTYIVEEAEESQTPNPAVEEAEKEFEAEIRKVDEEVTEDDIFVALDNGSWDDLNGNEIIINWSHIQNR